MTDNASPSNAIGPSVPPAKPSTGRRVSLFVPFLAALAGGVVAWALIDRAATAFEIPAELNIQTVDPEVTARQAEARHVRDLRNTSLALAVCGGCLAAAVGLAVGFTRSAAAAVIGLVAGGVLGAVTGAIGGLADFWLFDWLGDRQVDDALRTMAAHAAAWICIGAGVGLTVALTDRRPRSAFGVVVAGMGAGLLAGLLFGPTAAFLFPLAPSDMPIPEGNGNRLYWICLAAGLIGLAVGRVHAAARPISPPAGA